MRGIAALLLLAACNETPVDLGPFTIQPVLDTRPGSGCESATCQDYGMSCGAVVSIRILDTEDDDRIVGSSCQTVPPDDTLCGLANLNRGTFFNIPPHRLRIELAAWREEVLAGQHRTTTSSTCAARRSPPSRRSRPSPAPTTTTPPAAATTSPRCTCSAPSRSSSTRSSARWSRRPW